MTTAGKRWKALVTTHWIHSGVFFLFAALAPFPLPVSANVVINEIMYHPFEAWPTNQMLPSTNNSEYVELYNTGTSTVDLASYRFDNGITFSFPAGTFMATGSYLVICQNIAGFTNYYPGRTNYIGAYSGSLNNNGERITLSRLSGTNWVTEDTIDYNDGNRADGEGPSLELVNPGFARLNKQYTGDWLASTTTNGTPGYQNSVYSANPLPVVGNVKHAPPLPPAGCAVKITARVTGRDGNGMTSVQLNYRKDGASLPAWSTTPMNDTGIDGDETAGDGTYTAHLPPYGQPAFTSGSLYQFTITAVDPIGSRTYPFTNTASAYPPYTYLFAVGEDTNNTGEYATYHLLMTTSTVVKVFAETGGGPTSDTYTNNDATLIVPDGEIFYGCGVQQRGSTRVYPYGYAIELPDGRKYDGWSKLDFSYQNQFNNWLGMKVTEAAGVPALKVQLMRLWLNDVLLQPSNMGQQMYFRLERLQDATDRLYPGDRGNLYKADGDSYRIGDLSYWSSVSAYWQTGTAGHGYQCFTGNPYRAWFDLQNLTWSLNQSPTGLAATVTNVVTSVHEWSRLLAVCCALNYGEAGMLRPAGIGGDELRVYGNQDGKFTWFPWDYSDILRVGDNPTPILWGYVGGTQGTVTNFLYTQTFAPYYVGDVLDVLTNVMSWKNMNAWFDELGSAMTNMGTNWRTTYSNNLVSMQTALLPLISTNLTVNVNGQPITNDFMTVATTNVAAAYRQYVDQAPRGWRDLGYYRFLGVPGEFVRVTRVIPTSTTKTLADMIMVTNEFFSVIVDNMSTNFSATGNWTAGDYHYTQTQGDTATWQIRVPTAGLYHVLFTNLVTASSKDTNALYTIAPIENRIAANLSGTAPQNYTAAVLANGTPGTWSTRFNAWSTTAPLTSPDPTFPITVAAVGAEVGTLASRSFTLVAERSPQDRTGTVSSDTTWAGTQGVYRVTGDVTVTSGATLTIASNTTVLFQPGARILVSSGTLNLAGAAGAPVYLYPRTNGAAWSIQVSGSSVVTGSYANLVGGRLTAGSGTQLRLSDCSLSYYPAANGILDVDTAAGVSLIRCLFTDYSTAFIRSSPAWVESCLFTRMSVSGLELVNAGATATLLRSTFSNSAAAGADGLRLSGGTGCAVSNTHFAVLSGAGLVLSNAAPSVTSSVIHDCGRGVLAASSPSALLRSLTISDCGTGLVNVTAAPANCILWGNVTSASGGPASMTNSDVELFGSGLWPGTANMNRTPWFSDEAQDDYRLLSISPCIGAGDTGTDIGALFPVGAEPLPPEALAVTNALASQMELRWLDMSTDEDGFEVQQSLNGGPWVLAANGPANATNCILQGLLPETQYAFRVRAVHARGASFYTATVTASTTPTTTLQALRDSLRITEIMYNPADPPPGSPYTDNDDFEFLELQNRGAAALNLTGLYFSDGIDFAFTNGTTLATNASFVLVMNPGAFTSRYPSIPYRGVYTGKLDNAGERLRIRDALSNEVLDVTYDDAWYPTTDGGGYSLVLAMPDGNPDEAGTWRSSTQTNGSPNATDPTPAYGTILINEILTHQDADNPGDWIELYNAGTGSVDIGYWYLSDDENVLTNYRIPAGTVLPPGGYVVFTEHDDFGKDVLGASGFALSEWGETLFLSSGDSSGRVTSYRTFETFGAAENPVPFGRFIRSDGDKEFVAMETPTPGASNSYPKVGPIVINEVMYNPREGGKEYIELLNTAGTNVPLFDVAYPTNTWSFSGDLAYVFPTNTWMAPGECVVICSVDPAEFRQVTGLTNAAIQVFGPFDGALNNSGDSVRLYKPNTPEPNGLVPQVLVERVKYTDSAPWPALADNGGPSLERITPLAYGNEPTNWLAYTLGGTPGSSNNVTGLPTVAFSASDETEFQTNHLLSVGLSLYPPCTSTVTVSCVLEGGTATSGSDFFYTNTVVTFWPYETAKTVLLDIRDDSPAAAEPDETVVLTLTSLSDNAILGGARRYTCTLVDLGPGNLPAPSIAPAGTTYFTNAIQVTLGTSTTGAVVRYTTDGTYPDSHSPLYAGPFALTYGARLTARAFLGSSIMGATTSALFIAQTPEPAWIPPTLPSNAIEVVVAASSDDAYEEWTDRHYMRLTDTNIPLGSTSQPVYGFRFDKLAIPAGKTITNAYIQFTAAAAASGSVQLSIAGEAADSAPTFTSSLGDISTRLTTTNAVAWTLSPWYAGDRGAAQRTPDITGVIQEIVSRPGWAISNAIAIVMTNVSSSATRSARTYDAAPGQAAVLHVEWDTYVPPPVYHWFQALTNGFGTVTGGSLWILEGSNVSATAMPDSYSLFAGWSGDVGAADTNSEIITVVMDTNRTVTANFAEKIATNDVPYRWLAGFYETNDFDAAALSDTDADGMQAWQELRADTDPTNPASVLQVLRTVPFGSWVDISWLSRTSRVYSVQRTTNLVEGWTAPPLTSGIPGDISGTNVFTDTDAPTNEVYYRIGVETP